MYDELVKRLRTMADWVGIRFLDDSENVRTNLSEAADAIEELQAEINEWIEQERDFLLRSVPKWIPVTERLPEGNGRYLAVLKRYGFVDDIKLNDEQIRIMRYHDKWYLPYHVPDWINDTLKQEVTHWMPLPEPPKEK